jgi:hypothetical protein
LHCTRNSRGFQSNRERENLLFGTCPGIFGSVSV